MRFLLLFVLALAGTQTLSAQYEKGGWYLDANTGLRLTGNRNGSDGLLSGRIRGGYFLRERLLVGLDTEITDFSNDGRLDGARTEVFARYYFSQPGERGLNFFGEAGFGYDLSGYGSTSLTAAVGFEKLLTPGIVATATLRYRNESGRAPNAVNLRVGTNLLFGQFSEDRATRDYFHRRGDLMLDANVGNIGYSGTSSIDYLSGDLELRGGYFLRDNLLLTGSLGFSRSRLDYGSVSTTEEYIANTTLSAAAGLQYIFRNGKRFQPYLSAQLRYDYQRDRRVASGVTNFDRLSTARSLSADLRAGFLYHLSNRAALDFNVGVRPNLYRSGFSSGVPTVGSLGLKVFLGKR